MLRINTPACSKRIVALNEYISREENLKNQFEIQRVAWVGQLVKGLTQIQLRSHWV